MRIPILGDGGENVVRCLLYYGHRTNALRFFSVPGLVRWPDNSVYGRDSVKVYNHQPCILDQANQRDWQHHENETRNNKANLSVSGVGPYSSRRLCGAKASFVS